VALAVVTAAVYINSLPNGFHYDDVPMILKNPAVKQIERLPEHFWSVTIGNQDGTPSYRPLVMVSYGLNYRWGGENPVGYHVVNIALHVMASVLVALLLWQLSANALAACLGGAMFALHPIQTEAVNYITARSSVLYSATAIAAVVAFIRFRATGRRLTLVGAIGAYAASLLTKEAAVIAPLLLIGYDVIIRRCGWTHRSAWMPAHAPFILVTIAYLVLRQHMMGEVIPPAYHGDVVTTALTFAAIVSKTLMGQFFPFGLSVSHPFGPIPTLTRQALGAVVVCIGLVVVGAVARRRASLLAYAALWFPAALLPLAALTWTTPLALYQENRGYLSAAALAFVVGPFLAWCWALPQDRSPAVWLRRTAVITLLGAMSVSVIARNPVWRDDVSLWRDALAGAPGNQAAYVNLGVAYQARGDFESAAEVYRRALERFPNNGMLYNNLGAIYQARGDVEKAVEAFRAAIRVTPWFAMSHFNLATNLEEAGARDEAIAVYRRFLELAPGQLGTGPSVAKARRRLMELERAGQAGAPP
jgi:hypothetical protein